MGRGALQELAQDQLMSTVSKWSQTLAQAERGAEFAGLAYTACMTAPRGHTHLSVPIPISGICVHVVADEATTLLQLSERIDVHASTLHAL